jgi:hypothetical protein
MRVNIEGTGVYLLSDTFTLGRIIGGEYVKKILSANK